jgi:hypothetical protein
MLDTTHCERDKVEGRVEQAVGPMLPHRSAIITMSRNPPYPMVAGPSNLPPGLLEMVLEKGQHHQLQRAPMAATPNDSAPSRRQRVFRCI